MLRRNFLKIGSLIPFLHLPQIEQKIKMYNILDYRYPAPSNRSGYISDGKNWFFYEPWCYKNDGYSSHDQTFLNDFVSRKKQGYFSINEPVMIFDGRYSFNDYYFGVGMKLNNKPDWLNDFNQKSIEYMGYYSINTNTMTFDQMNSENLCPQ